jgi:hypothetical protein
MFFLYKERTFCNVSLHCGNATSQLAWHLGCLEARPFHVAWYLQHVAHDICSIFEFQPSILHGDLPFWMLFGAFRNLDLLTSSFTCQGLLQQSNKKSKIRTQSNNIETAGNKNANEQK